MLAAAGEYRAFADCIGEQSLQKLQALRVRHRRPREKRRDLAVAHEFAGCAK